MRYRFSSDRLIRPKIRAFGEFRPSDDPFAGRIKLDVLIKPAGYVCSDFKVRAH